MEERTKGGRFDAEFTPTSALPCSPFQVAFGPEHQLAVDVRRQLADIESHYKLEASTAAE